MDLFIDGDFNEFHIFFHNKNPGDDDDNGYILSIEFIRSDDLDYFGYS
jgi:hypothetical protein